MTSCYEYGMWGYCGWKCPFYLVESECGMEPSFLDKIIQELDKIEHSCYNSIGGSIKCQQQKQTEWNMKK